MPCLPDGSCSLYVLNMASNGKPPWLAPKAAAAMHRAFVLAALRGADGIEAARSAAWAWHPALPAPMIAEAVACVMGLGEEQA